MQLSLSASDPDGDLLHYEAAGLPAGLSVHSETGEISGTIGASAAGAHVVTASVSDGSEVSAVSFEWLVAPNSAPQVTDPGDQLNAVGDEVALSLLASDAEAGPLGFAASGLPFGLSIDPETGEIAGTLLSAGIHSVVVSVSDGVEATDVAFTWTVRARRAGIFYEYYEVAGLSALPDFDTLRPDAAAFVGGFDISVRWRNDGFAFRFTGVVDVPADGVWTSPPDPTTEASSSSTARWSSTTTDCTAIARFRAGWSSARDPTKSS